MTQLLIFLFSPKGRIGRLEFFLGMLFLMAVLSIITLLYERSSWLPFKFYMVILLPIGVSIVILQIKRFHDRNRSGWRLLVFLLLYLPQVLLIVTAVPKMSMVYLMHMGDVSPDVIIRFLPWIVSTTLAQHIVEMLFMRGTIGLNFYNRTDSDVVHPNALQ